MKKILAPLFLIALFLSACNSKTAQTTPVDTALDKKFFDEAISAGNLQKCDQILDKNLQKECRDFIDALNLTAQASQNLDLGTCNKIALKRAKDDCVNQVNTAIDAKNADTKRLSIEQDSTTKGDSEICNQINDTNQKASCKYNILANQAYQKKDPSLCEKIGLKDLIKKCKETASK